MIAIVDYGMGNLRSVQKAFEKVGHAATIVDTPAAILAADRVVLPGVGAFRDAMTRLREAGMDEAILGFLRAERPFLGICLGLQLLFETGQEDGEHRGLGWFAGSVVPFPANAGVKVPHMGWNRLTVRPGHGPVFDELPSGSAVYFVHGFFAAPADDTIVAATADYPTPFCAAVARGPVVATQFHPEKSQAVGLNLLRRFAESP
jgi:glutamine amidotransferase